MINVYNRKTKKYDTENVAGGKYIKWAYESPLGKGLTELLIKKKFFSRVYGLYCDSSFSRKKISPFIKNFNIDMAESLKKEDEFNSFNDFFIRELGKSSRPIDPEKTSLISPGDGRLTCYTNISMNEIIQVKDIHYSLSELIQNAEIASKYEGGTCLVLRLCPTDYHRFHFVDWGTCKPSKYIPGNYYSVNPTALERIPKLYCQNKREWSVFHSENFDDIIHIEVGATCVGSIVQNYNPNIKVNKGDEKGYFKFGGSTTILFFKTNTITIDEDILVQSSLGFETKVNMGEKIGVKFNKVDV